MRTKIIYIFIFLLVSSTAYSQKEYFNWYFGHHAGITFNTSDMEPKALIDGKILNRWGAATISDSAGNLLFYTDGWMYVNNKHEPMDSSYWDSLDFGYVSNFGYGRKIILSNHNNKNLFYVINQPGASINASHWIKYNVVDISYNNNQGSCRKHQFKIIDSCIFNFTIAKHGNNQDTWLISRLMNSNKFVSVKLSEDGFELKKISKPGIIFNGNGYGQMKVSPQGDRLVVTIYHQNGNEFGMIGIYDFNNMTGEISNEIFLNKNVNGVEFSPDGSKVYFSVINKSDLYQINLTAGSEIKIRNSFALINPEDSIKHHDLQLGPNGKIYVANAEKGFLSVINNPNGTVDECDYQIFGVDLESDESNPDTYHWCYHGLPFCMPGAFNVGLKFDCRDVCLGDTLFLKAGFSMDKSGKDYKWTGPDGFVSDEQYTFIPNAGYENEGWYSLSAESDGIAYKDSIYIEVVEIEAEIKKDKEIMLCERDSAVLTAYPEGEEYLWSTGETSRTISVYEAGDYSVTVSNYLGCEDVAEILVETSNEMSAYIDGPDVICSGEPIELKAFPFGSNYDIEWSTGETANSITIDSEGEYFIKIVSKAKGCIGSDTITIKAHPKPSVEITGDEKICKNGTGTLETDKEFISYLWSNNETTPTIEINSAGQYWVETTDINGCKARDMIEVEYYPSSNPKILGKTKICQGSSTNLSADKDYAEYRWSTGADTKEIEATEAGEYELIVINEYGCADTARTTVEILPSPKPEILGPESFCKGETALLSADKDYDSYEWSRGETTKEISIQDAGEYWLKVSDENGCEGFDTIQIKHIEMDIEIGPQSLDFELVWLDEGKTLEIKISNNNDFDIEYDLEDVLNNFKISGYSGLISPNDNEKLTIEFIPDNIIDYSDLLKINITAPCHREYSVSITGGGKAELLARIEDTHALIGDKACIPIYAKINAGNISSTADLDMQIKLDARAIETDIAGTINNNERTISISKSGLTITDNEIKIGEICGMALIGNEDAAPVQFAEFNWSDKHLVIDTTNGFLFPEGVCKRDISRIKKFEKTRISISPVPARENIKINIISEEKGAFVLKIYNLQGMEMSSYSWSATAKSDKEIIINTEDYSGGLYQAVLTGPCGAHVESLLILE